MVGVNSKWYVVFVFGRLCIFIVIIVGVLEYFEDEFCFVWV